MEKAEAMKHPLVEFVLITLRNISQVVLQCNALSGLVILVGIFHYSLHFGIAAIAGSVAATLTAMFFKSDEGMISAGLYGFNGVLTAISIVFYCESAYDLLDISLFLLGTYVFFGAVFSTIMTAAIGALTTKWDVAPLTAPFVLASWLFVAGTHFSPALAPGHNLPPKQHAELMKAKNAEKAARLAEIEANKETHHLLRTNWFEAIGKGMGEIFFEDDVVSGYLILLAIFINSRISGIMAIIGATVSIVVAELLHVDELTVDMGMYSYSAVLTAIALGGLFLALNVRGFVFTILAVILTTWLYPASAEVLDIVHLSAYTTPFILATWLMLFGKDAFHGIVAVPLAEATKPEDHFRFLTSGVSS